MNVEFKSENLKVAKTVTDTNDNVWNVDRVYRNQPRLVEVHIGKERDIKMSYKSFYKPGDCVRFEYEYEYDEEELQVEDVATFALELMVDEGYFGCYDNEETGETIYYVLENRH